MEFINYLVGFEFPDPKYYGYEGPVLRIAESGFEILVCMPDISEAEVLEWQNRPIQYGLFVRDAIPFFVGEFAHNMYIDSSFNILQLEADQRKLWMDQIGGNVILFLIDSKTYRLKLIRPFAVSETFLSHLKTTLQLQENTYSSHLQVDKKILQIHEIYDNAKAMIETVAPYSA